MLCASETVQQVKNLLANAGDTGDLGLIPEWGRFPGEGSATHSSIHVWRIPWTEECGGLQLMGSQKSDVAEDAIVLHS